MPARAGIGCDELVVQPAEQGVLPPRRARPVDQGLVGLALGIHTVLAQHGDRIDQQRIEEQPTGRRVGAERLASSGNSYALG